MATLRCSCCGLAFDVPSDSFRLEHSSLKVVCSIRCLDLSIMSHDFGQYDYPLGALTGDLRVTTGEATYVSEVTGEGYRSRFEGLVAEWLADKGELCEYEPCTFQVGERSHYTPDFWLPRRGVFLEVKGKWGYGQRSKMERFRRERPDIDLLLIPWRLHGEFDSEEARWDYD